MKKLLCMALAFEVMCCISCHNKSDVYNEGDSMRYIVSKTTGPVELGIQWNSGQWGKAKVLELKNHMGQRPEHFPKTLAKLLYDDENLYIFFRVEDQYVRAIAIIESCSLLFACVAQNCSFNLEQ